MTSPDSETNAAAPKSAPRRSRIRSLLRFIFHPATIAVLIVLISFTAYSVVREFKTSRIQAWYFTSLGKELTFAVEKNKSPRIRFPKTGPYDTRLGYTRIPAIMRKLTGAEYRYGVTSQARISPAMEDIVDAGIFPIYREKTQTGLSIVDRENESIFRAEYPERIYRTFEDIPPLVLQTLLYIENRELLDDENKSRNPAIEWDRFAKAAIELASRKVTGGDRGPGGSTIATQLEKYRHSPEGRTSNPRDKFRQMATATIRAYMNGEHTLETRKQIVLDYINSIPLAAIRGYGEVNGLGDGLWAWFGSDFNEINAALRLPDDSRGEVISTKGRAYIQVLSLFLAHRRPSAYLLTGRDELRELSHTYIELMRREGLLEDRMAEFVRSLALPFRREPPIVPQVSFLDRKAANLVRTSLLSMFGMNRLYEIDRFDLSVCTTFDGKAQEALTAVMRKLREEKFVREAGLVGFRILEATANPAKVNYSFTLYERGDKVNYLRVETDNLDQPFNINKGVKLDLGSTSKFRTLVNYLQVIARLHSKYTALTPAQRAAIPVDAQDTISRWAQSYVSEHPQTTLLEMLEASMERQYSASPREVFFTGSGEHTFSNFDHEDDGQVMNLWDALKRSVNLVFIRLMRDLVQYYIFEDDQTDYRGVDRLDAKGRRGYLEKFADKEGSQFLSAFYQKYKGKSGDEIFKVLLSRVRVTPTRYAAVLRATLPEATLEQFSAMMRRYFTPAQLPDSQLPKHYKSYEYALKTLLDRGYVAHLHPLEIWLAGYLYRTPEATRADALRDSTAARQEVYSWLFNSKHTRAQNTRIRIVVEADAFREMHRDWKKVGYPFETLVPSYATSIGSSGDKPAALSELMGIVLNDGMRYPTINIQRLRFAADTPFETTLAQTSGEGERIFPAEVAAVLKRALSNVVEHGTARRVFGAFKEPDGTVITVGGKTGTGDHRFDTYGAGGVLLKSRVVNRTATFVFYIGDRYFGTLTAFVPGEDAAKYKFTSALPVQLLKYLAPTLTQFIAAGKTSPHLTSEMGTIRRSLGEGGSLAAPVNERAPSETPKPTPAAPSP